MASAEDPQAARAAGEFHAATHAAAMAAWRKALEGLEGPTRLATARPSPAGTAEIESVEFTADAGTELSLLTARHGIKPAAVVYAAWAILLSRYTGSNDVVFGVAADSGAEPMTATAIMPFRVFPDPAETLLSLAARLEVQHSELSALAPLPPGAVEQLTGLTEIFDTVVEVESGGARHPVGRISHGALTVIVGTIDPLRLNLLFSSNFFSRVAVQSIGARLMRMLGEALVTPAQRVWQIDILSPDERKVFAEKWRDNERPVSADTLPQRIEEQAKRTPSAAALIFQRQELTYADLNERANRLAHHLIRLGAGPESRVGVAIERSPQLIIVLLAILKAGAAYVPLDPKYPSGRLASMLADANPRIVLTSRAIFPALARDLAFRMLVVDSDETQEELNSRSSRNPTNAERRFPLLPGHPALIIFTSGSTGKPKGAVIRHRSIVTLTDWAGDVFTREEWNGVLASTSIAFDLSVFEIFVTLARGGTVILSDSALDLPTLPAVDKVRLVNTVPSAARSLLDMGGFPRGVMTVNLAGEALSNSLVQDIYRAAQALRVYNLYGPSEDTTYSTFSFCPRGDDRDVAIGIPISNTRCYVLDSMLQLLPAGIAGELYLAGDGLARGYEKQPGLTAQRFIADPYGGPGERMYRTGDLVRRLEDGALEYLGRIDDQVKIRGFRIELGEIESALVRHPAVARAVVVAREDRPGQKHLAAYVVPADSAGKASDLRSYLSGVLPDYMVPAAIVELAELPLTRNGKIDKRALPAPTYLAGDTLPRNPEEELLAGIFSEVLRLPRMGVDDNFFELGGHSLLATRLIGRIRTVFGVELTLANVFAAPTVARLVKHLGGAASANPTLVSAPRPEIVPLSYAQRRLWFLYEFEPDKTLYNIPMTLRLRGHLNISALEHALSEIVRRHEALRTTVGEVRGIPVQVIQEAAPVELKVTDLPEASPDERERELWQRVKREAEGIFDLRRGPLLRTLLLRMNAEDHVLLLTMHHIAGDGWSLEVLSHELKILYEARLRGGESPLPALPIQYADYSLWQRQWLSGKVEEKQLAYWRGQLADFPSALQLPQATENQESPAGEGAEHEFNLPPELLRDLRGLSRGKGVTLYMTLLAAFQLLLHRYSGEPDIVIGGPIAGRTRSETEGMIGFFVNTLLLRTRISGNPRFADLLTDVRATALAAYENQDLPFERVVEELQPDRAAGGTPLVQVMFDVRKDTWREWSMEGVQATAREIDFGRARFDLNVYFTETDETLDGVIQYRKRAMDAEAVHRMADHMGRLLRQIVAEPETRIGDLQFLPPEELRYLLTECNRTQADYERGLCVHELFEMQAARSPEAPALRFGGRELTYRELNRKSNQLAHDLRRRGVGPETMVALCIERSPEMIIGTLAILKAGGAYLPLDPEQPTERLAWMMRDAGAALLLTQKQRPAALAECPVLVLDPDGEWFRATSENGDNPEPVAVPENLAYVMYTSGSTGRPKGSGIIHRSIARLVRNTNFADFANDTVTLQIAPVSFDASTLDIWSCLLNGGRLEIMPAGTPSFEALARAIQDRGVNSIFLTAGLFHQMVEHQREALKGVRQLMAGGDVLSPVHVKKLLEDFPGGRLVNAYGPTENTVCTCCHSMRGPFVGDTVPIGRPVSNTQVYVLDIHGMPVPAGVAGELYTGGDGLARGYVNRPDLTAEKFVPNPFGETEGDRLYRTGDLVRLQKDGLLEFLGRIDQQVKIRGFRIEPGEIEAALLERSEVREAIVVAHRNTAGEKTLVAYVVAEGVSDGELRGFLKQRLPEYMVPGHIVRIAQLPLTPNGKVDRKALPLPEETAAETAVGYVPPRTPSEEIMAGIWSGLLGMERVSVHANFFELGGHSLRAMQVISRIRQVFAVELPVRRLFEYPTIAGVAECVDMALKGDSGSKDSGPPLVPRLSADRKTRTIHLSYAQKRLWFLYEFEADKALYNIPTALRVTGPPDVRALRQALAEILRRHEVLRTSIAESEGDPMQIIHPATAIELPVVDLEGISADQREQELSRRITAEALTPFDLHRAPLLRALLLRLNADDHVLTLTLHHIAGDGWSLQVLARELGILYEAFSHGRPSPPEELPVQYADYAVWQQEWLQGAVEEKQLAYWRKQLAAMPGGLDLPMAGPRPAVPDHHGALHTFLLPPDLVTGLKELGRKEGVTQFIILLTALQDLLGRYSGEADIAVGTPIAGRTRAETEAMIGFFVNTLVIRTDLSGNPSFSELLGRVRETALGAYSHQDLPFERLVEDLHLPRERSRTPLFQVMLVLLNDMQALWKLGDLQVREQKVELEREKFDLTVQFLEHEEQMEAEISYRTELFDAVVIHRMAGHLQLLLQAMVASTDSRIAETDLLSPAERRQILVEWNATARTYPEKLCIHQMFERQAERSPHAPAVIFEDRQVSYRELNEQANQLAHYLRELGIGPESLVGICIERSVEMVVGLLAILKAGGAYVPMDPNYPAERLAYMLEDAGVRVLLTQATLTQGHLSTALEKSETLLVCMDHDHDIIRCSTLNPSVPLDSENLAYMIYTSGSTGRPKGAMNRHGAIRNRLLWMQEAYGLQPHDRVLQKTPFSFDVSVWEFFWPLMTGAALVIARPQGHRDSRYLAEIVVQQRITTLHFVPSMLDAFLQTPEAELCTGLRRVICSGEALSLELSGKFFTVLQAELYNLYGPTEAAVDVTYWPCRPDGSDNVLPIGRPIANIQIHVLDEELKPVPVGVAGEIYIAGEGLGRGYWRRPDLTGERFLPNPHSDAAGERMYRSGDRGRYLEDGAIDFLGRLDHQVKIRGFRIEPGEIESVLAQHPAVAQVAVVAREQSPGQLQLVAYVVAVRDTDLNSGDLRRHAGESLPDYMVPAAFVQMEALPLTVNGKLDRNALPAAEIPTRASRPPRTPEEKIVADLFAEVLGIEQVGADDNFFDLGGHSLLAMRLVSRLRTVLFLDVPVNVIFDKPAVSEFTKAMMAYESKAGLTKKIIRIIQEEQSVSAP